MPEGTSIEETEAAIAAIDEQIAPVVGEDLIATTARVGHLSVLALDRNSGSTDNIGYISAIMKPVDRLKTCGEWAEILAQTLATPSGATITFEAKPIGPPVGFPVQIHVAGNQDLDRRSTAQLVALELGKIEGLTDINIDEKPGIRQIDLNPEYDKMAMYGISPKVVGQTLKAALYGVEVSELRTLDETMKFRVMFDQRTRTDLDGLLDAPILTQQRQTVSLVMLSVQWMSPGARRFITVMAFVLQRSRQTFCRAQTGLLFPSPSMQRRRSCRHFRSRMYRCTLVVRQLRRKRLPVI